ncbi:MAG: hypothetical protein WCT03_18380 [Candidatus Obscuribacterales bacterium]|jgi:hypothetical protein
MANGVEEKQQEREKESDLIFVDWQWRESGQDSKIAVSEKESLVALVKLQASSPYFDMTKGDSEKLESWIEIKAKAAKISDDQLSLLRKAQNLDYVNIRYFEPIEKERENEARQVESVRVLGDTYDKSSDFGMEVFDALARKEKAQLEKLEFSESEKTRLDMDAVKLWLADREREFAKDPERENKIMVSQDDVLRDETVRVTLKPGDLSLRALAEIKAQGREFKLTKEDDLRLDAWLDEKGKEQGLKPKQVQKLVRCFDPLYEDSRAHDEPNKDYDDQVSTIDEVLVQGVSYSKNAPELAEGFKALATSERAHLEKLEFEKAEEVTIKMEALARWMDRDKGRSKDQGRTPGREKNLARDISAGSALRSKIREKGKSRGVEKDHGQKGDGKSEPERDMSKDDFI